jgi:DNA-binding NarL/FixJ family response regulator
MPNMDGIEFLQKYNPRDKHPKIKIILFSNFDAQDEIEKAYDLGVDKYVLKAWASPRDLIQLIDGVQRL